MKFTKKTKEKLKKYLGKRIEVKVENDTTFIAGYEPECTLIDLQDDFIEVDDCDYGNKHQLFNVNQIKSISLGK